MMLPTEVIALAEARRESFEKEIRLQHQLSQLPQRPSRLRQWTGNRMVWAGARLVRWGESMAVTDCTQHVEVIG